MRHVPDAALSLHGGRIALGEGQRQHAGQLGYLDSRANRVADAGIVQPHDRPIVGDPDAVVVTNGSQSQTVMALRAVAVSPGAAVIR